MRRSVCLLAIAGLLIQAPVVPSAVAQVRSAPLADQGLCRRAPALIQLPPEQEGRPQGSERWESRLRGTPPPSPAPPPPPPPPRMAPEPAAAAAPPAGAMDATARGSRAPAVAESGVRGGERVPGPRPSGQVQSGQLTAGEHDDLLNPRLYQRYVDRFLATETVQGVPRVDTGRVLAIEVQDGAGRPVPFAPVMLTCSDGNTLTLQTMADGRAVFFPELDRLGDVVTMQVRGQRNTSPSNRPRRLNVADVRGPQSVVARVSGPVQQVGKFDLALVVDTTGSMGDELEYLKAELRDIVGALRARHRGLDVRVSLIVYRDQGDEYITRTFGFTGDIDSVQGALERQVASGGGDYPEAVEYAMNRAVSLPWRPDAVKSILFVADAPPHTEDVATTWNAAEVARGKRIHVTPVAASGVGEGAEYIMRAMAAATQSRYLFLTDDSGIGNAHAEPDVDCYHVTRLDALVRRVLDSQISGRRIEPDEGEIVRTVGTYDRGRCLLPESFGRE